MSPSRFLAYACRGETPRRWTCALLVSMYAFAAAGVPLPLLAPKTGAPKSTALFPCSASGCGCDSAEKCWRSCCCHTLAERLAWAEKNGVEPPAFALAAAKEAGLDVSGRPLVVKSVNAILVAKTCCSAKRSCCSSHAKSCCKSRDSLPHEADSNFIVAWRAMACHGQSLQWLAAVPSLITVDFELSDRLALSAWLGPHASDSASPLFEAPSTPPPERA